MWAAYAMQVEQFTNALQRQSAREEEGGEEEGGLPEAAEDLADEMAVAALSRTITSREDTSPGVTKSNGLSPSQNNTSAKMNSSFSW